MQETISDIIGFDLGHGESALAIADLTAITEPQILDIQNEKSFITAVAVHPKRGVIIGEEAYTARHLTSLRVRFKSAQLDEPEVREPIKLFVNKVLDLLQANHLLRAASHFIVGCPSSWPPAVRAQYAQLMQEAGLSSVSVVAESRAAFIHAKEANELRLSTDWLKQSVLIVDIGSSTTDFTAVHNLSEHYIDFGDSQLGAGLLDKAILASVMAKHARGAELQQIFQQHPQYEAMCELKCRRVKEMYFANEDRWIEEPAADTLKLPTLQPLFFDVELTQQDMLSLLDTPVLHQLSWPAAFEAALSTAKQQMQAHPPDLIFLTGGASRMGFTAQICQTVFPTAQVVRGKEPELSIAKGLAWTGRIDHKAQAFRQAVAGFLASGQLQQIVAQHVPQLLTLIADVLAHQLPEQVVLPLFRRWRQGQVQTLNDLEPLIEAETETWLTSPAGKQCLTPAVETWFKTMTPAIEAHLNPLCDQYHIPRTSFNLLSQETWRGKLPGGLATDVNQLWGFDGLHTITGLIVVIVVANLVGGSGVALLLHGPVGLVLGVIVGLVAFAFGKQAAERWIQQADLHPWLRKLAREERLSAKLLENKYTLQAALIDSLGKNTETLEKIAHDVSHSIESQLNQVVEAVVVLIK